jgi:predicted O-methyltransferase YrrM
MSDIIKFDTVTQAFGIQRKQMICCGEGLGAMVAQMENPKVLEIGCDIGHTSQFLLDSNPTLELIGVDPYENYIDWNGNNLNEREDIYQKFSERLKGYSNRFKLYREYSDNMHHLIEDESLDLIFIDGLHTYDQLTKDCNNFYSKLKEGGIFSGHDYNAIPGVHQAANEFAAKVGREIHFTEHDVWYWVK